MRAVLHSSWGNVCFILCALSLLAGDLAAAQEEAAPAEVEEITVTARKREERLQDTPISVTALSSDMLEDKGVSSVIDITQFTPNVNMHTNTGGSTGVTLGIRGAITTDPLLSLEPAAGIYVDGVYVAKSVGSQFDMADLERIEVMRGPQGTLYGRNTIGGAINLITKKPTDELSASSTFAAGNFDYFKNTTTLNFPVIGENGLDLSDTWGTLNARGTFTYRARDGFYENTGTGSNRFDDLNRFATRAALRWQRENLSLDYQFDYHRSREDPTAFQLSGIWPGALVGIVHPTYSDFITNNRRDSLANNNILNPDGTMQDQENDLDVRGHGLTASADLGEVGPLGVLTLKSITGVRNLNQSEAQDIDGSPFHIGDFSSKTHYEQLSEEVQLLGNAVDGRLDYVVGFYYFDEEGRESNPQVIFGGGFAFISADSFNNRSYAPFGQTTYTPPILDDRLSLTAGLRYTREEKEVRRNYDCLVVNGTACDPAASFDMTRDKNFDNLSPMGSVAYKVADDFMAYGTISRGFKSGGFNGRATTRDTFRDPFDAETLTSYELGFKSQWLDNRLRLNADGFLNDYNDLQVTVFRADPNVGTATTLENAADAEIWGAEVELTAVPVPGVDVNAAYALLRPRYNKFCEATDPVTGACTADVADERKFVIAPEHVLSAGVRYTASPTDFGTFSVAVDGYWQSEVNFLVKDNEFIKQTGYVLFNARAQLAEIPTEYGSFDLSVWSRNLFDKKYKVFGIDFGKPRDQGFGFAGNMYGNPRTFGLELAYRWEEMS